MLRDGGAAHRHQRRQVDHGQRALTEALEDGSAGRVAEGAEGGGSAVNAEGMRVSYHLR